MGEEIAVLVQLQPCGRIVAVQLRIGQIVGAGWPEPPGADCQHGHTGLRIGAAWLTPAPDAPIGQPA